jgi:hypothetical protein
MGLTGRKIGPWKPRLNRAVLAPALLLWGLPLAPSLRAQAGSILLPNDIAPFEFPLASHRASAMIGRMIYLGRGESAFGNEWEGEAALGEVWPLLAVRRGSRPITLHLGSEVYGRFSLGDASSSMISSDWHVNLMLTLDLPRWRLGVEAYHESSHLGDEYHDRFPGPRVNWSREILGLWASRIAGPFLVSGNASLAVLDVLDLPGGAFAVGVDWRGKRGSVSGGGSAQPILALHADVQQYADWEPTLSGRAGVRFSDPARRRGFALLLTYLHGMSPQRQFYLEKSRYLGMEVRFDL